ncbi:MAG: diacylglycerol kinase [Candidatus Saccharimonadia bacterium]
MSKLRRLILGFKYALVGLEHILRNEQNARIHLVVAVTVLVIGFIVGLTSEELAAVFFAIIIVFIAEVLNTAIERTLDLIEPEVNGKVAIIKDMSAGAVLVAATGATIIGVVIFWPYMLQIIYQFNLFHR